MSKDDDDAIRRDAPEGDEWQYLWLGAQRGHKAWMIVGPVHAVVTNWKLILGALAFVAWINRPEILAALDVLTGGGK